MTCLSLFVGAITTGMKFRGASTKRSVCSLAARVGRSEVSTLRLSLAHAHRAPADTRNPPLPLLLKDWLVVDSVGYSEELLDRNVYHGWNPTIGDQPMFRNYPAYEPVFVLKNIAPL